MAAVARGQQLLIGGLAIAVSLIVLVSVLNGVLFTEDLRTRDATRDLRSAGDYESGLDREYGEVLDRVNAGRHTTWASARDAVAERVFAINRLMGEQYAVNHGIYATTDGVRMANATVLVQDADCGYLARNTDCGSTGSNQPPYPTFTYLPDNPTAGSSVDFDGSGSTDPDGSVASYDWDLKGGVGIEATGATVSYTYTNAGVYNVSLTVTDGDGASATTSRWVTVAQSDGDLPPNASFTYSPAVGVRDTTLTLDAGPTTDPDSTIADYDWRITSPSGDLVTRGGETATVTPTESGRYEVELTVTDGQGISDSRTRTVRVLKPADEGGGVTDGSPPFTLDAPTTRGFHATSGVATAPNAPDWRLVTTTHPRSVEFTPVRSSLSSVASSAADSPTALEDTFYVRVEGAEGKRWDAHVFVDSFSGNLTVSTRTGGTSGSATVRYSGDVSEAHLDLTRGTVEGEQVFRFAPKLEAPYRIGIRNGDEANGTFSLVAREDGGATDVETQNFHAADSGRAPYRSAGVYSIAVPVTFDTPTSSRRATVYVAPGEPVQYNRSQAVSLSGAQYVAHDELVYADAGELRSIAPTAADSGSVTTYAASNVESVGPKQVDFDGDGRGEIPYVTGSNTLKLIDSAGETRTLARGAKFQKTILAAGKWRGSFSVFYINGSDGDKIYRASPTGQTSAVLVGGNGVAANSLAGVSDYNGDGDRDLVLTGTSSTVKYIDDDTVSSTGVSVASSSTAGIGDPRDFGFTNDRAPIVKSNNVKLLAYDKSTATWTTSGKVVSSSASGIDWDGDGSLEVAHLRASGSFPLGYVQPDGSVVVLVDGNGNKVYPDEQVGIA